MSGYMYNGKVQDKGISTDNVDRIEKWVEDMVREGYDAHDITITYYNGTSENGYDFMGYGL